MTAPLALSSTALPLDPRTYDRALACVHCGLCLPACPTYVITGHEADSPRGRIQLMRGLADGDIAPSAGVVHHLDLCLDCRGCETACPSGVVYHELIEETRARFAEAEELHHREHDTPPLSGRLMRWIFFHLFTRPTRLKWALLPARLMQKVGLYGLLRKSGLFDLLPVGLRKMEQMLPPTGPLWPRKLPALTPPKDLSGTGGSPVNDLNHGRAAHATLRVGFFAGCVGSVMFDRVNRQAVELLSACGAEVIAPRGQGCCGAIHHHNSRVADAEAMVRHTIDTFLPAGKGGVDVIATTIAGCGAMLREYDVLLRDDPEYAARAKEFARRMRDVSEVLVTLGLPGRQDLLRHSLDLTVTYHDACHLAHAQKVTSAPRQLLAAIPGLRIVALPESDLCCGAAGTYNLTQPAMSAALAERKLDRIASTGAAVCVTGNVGCAMQISSEAAARGRTLAVVHPVELLHRVVFGDGRHG